VRVRLCLLLIDFLRDLMPNMSPSNGLGKKMVKIT
jgi:hypothetical protein